MPSASWLLSGTAAFLLLMCVFTTCFGKNIKDQYSYPSLALFFGGATMLFGAVLGWQTDCTWAAPPPFYFAVAPLSCHIDPLSSIFIGLLSVITIAVSLYSPGYLRHLKKVSNLACYWVSLIFFVLSMLAVILAANAMFFLVAWETMALSSILLVATNLSSHESRKAAFIYLGTTRIATGLLMAGFLWMYTLSQTWEFSHWHFSTRATAVPGLMIFIGLSIKSGIWPFHDWLPYAHPAAPAPVSALMSGVMIKVSLYAIIRLLVMGDLTSPFFGYLMLTLGIISAFWGILFALQQDDLKALLAYSSIENVGLVLAAVGLALIGERLHLPILSALSLTAAIFHCINHGLFKSLLFLATGSIDSKSHTRNLDHLGGLGKNMPRTLLLFFIGSAALCALPPLNGFSSKWLVYKSLFRLACVSKSLWVSGFAVACTGVLALVGALAIACFTKALGMAFLGRARSRAAEHATEVDRLMQSAQFILAFGCIVLGVCAPMAMKVIKPVCTAIFGNDFDLTGSYTMPMSTIAALMAILTLITYALFLAGKRGGVKRFITWECGFGDLSQRMQGTALSFAENIATTFAPLLLYKVRTNISGRDRRHFPEQVAIEVTSASFVETRIYNPTVRFVRWFGERMLLLQAGSVHLYLGYILLTLVVLMLVGILF